MSVDDSDVYHCYMSLWKTVQKGQNLQYQGIDTSSKRNVTRIRVEALDKGASY